MPDSNYTKIDAIKDVVGVVVGAGSTTIVKEIIKNNVGPGDSTIDVVKIWMASAALGSMVASAVGNHTDEKIDRIIATISGIREKMKEMKETAE